MSVFERALSHPLSEIVGWSLVHFVWQGAAITLLLAIALRGMRRSSASVRYLTACTALTMMAVCPVLTAGWLARDMEWPADIPKSIRSVDVVVPEVAQTERDIAPAVSDEGWHAQSTAMGVTRTHDIEPATPFQSVPPERPLRERVVTAIKPALPWMVGVWLVGVSLLSGRLLMGWVEVQRLRRSAIQPVGESYLETFRQLAARLRVSRPVRLVESALVEVPTVVGWLRPMILLPASAITGLTADQLQAVLAHELAHIRRHDYLVNLLQTVAETLLFYHPAVWWVSHRIRLEREHCCDDIAVQICGDRVAYARMLVTLESLRTPVRLAMTASGGSLLNRIRRLVGGRPKPSTNRSTWWLAGVLAMTTVAALGLSLYVTSRADESPAAIKSEKNGDPRSGNQWGHETPAEPEIVTIQSGTGRGSPDPAPTAVLPNSDEETNPPNNANGDLRSNPAAGSADPRRAQNRFEFRFQVTNAQGKPVAGAKVTPTAVMNDRSDFNLELDRKWCPEVTTDAKGVALITISKEQFKEKRFKEAAAHAGQEGLWETISDLELRVDHPQYAIWSSFFDANDPAPIELVDAATIEVRPRRMNDDTLLHDVMPIFAGYDASPADWLAMKEQSQKEGVLTIRRVDLSSQLATRWLRLVHIPKEGPAWFSDLIDLKPLKLKTSISLNPTLRPGVRVSGRLADSVPRPVENGRVVAKVIEDRSRSTKFSFESDAASAIGDLTPSWIFSMETNINKDGAFVFESVPADEDLQIIALCDGWVSRSPTAQELTAYAKAHGYETDDAGEPDGGVYPQVFRTTASGIQPIIPMERTTDCEVTVVDETGRPIADAKVSFEPNQNSFPSGYTGEGLGMGYDSLKRLRIQFQTGVPPKLPVEHERFQAKTNAHGIAVIKNFPLFNTDPTGPTPHEFSVYHDDYIAPIAPGSDLNRKQTVLLRPNQLGRVTLRMKAKKPKAAKADEETNQTNNAIGDLRSNPAAGSGDPRRTQATRDKRGGTPKPRLSRVEKALDQLVSFEFDKRPFGKVLDAFRADPGVPVEVSAGARAALETPIILRADADEFAFVLMAILDQVQLVAWVDREWLMIGTREEAQKAGANIVPEFEPVLKVLRQADGTVSWDALLKGRITAVERGQVTRLIELSSHQERVVRREALRSIAHLGAAAALKGPEAALAQAKQSDIQRVAWRAFAASGCDRPETLPTLVRAWDEGQVSVREDYFDLQLLAKGTADRAYGHGSPEFRQFLMQHIGDPDDYQRSLVMRGLNDRDAKTRLAAIQWGLVRSRFPASIVKELITRLTDDDASCRVAAASVLLAINHEPDKFNEALAVLIQVANDGSVAMPRVLDALQFLRIDRTMRLHEVLRSHESPQASQRVRDFIRAALKQLEQELNERADEVERAKKEQAAPTLQGPAKLGMTEPQFLEIVKQQELKTRKTVEGEKVTHHIALGDGHALIVMFDKDGKCSGIQRVRGEGDIPQSKESRALFQQWQRTARTNGNIPGGTLGPLVRVMRNFVKNNPTHEGSPKFAELLKRMDVTRDWSRDEAVKLLDEVAAIYASLPEWVEGEKRFSLGGDVVVGKPLPEELKNAPWGEAQPNGLRVAWLLEPPFVVPALAGLKGSEEPPKGGTTNYRLNTPLKSRILFHNAGKNSIVFRALTWNQSGEHKASDAQGNEIHINSTYWTTIPMTFACRLAPDEFLEVIGAGIGVGANKDDEDWRDARRDFRVGSWIEAKAGDEVTFSPAAVDVAGREGPHPEGDEAETTPQSWWLKFIKDRLSLDAPLPAAADERRRLLDRAVRDLFGNAPTPEEITAFTTDAAPDALDALAKRLANRAGFVPFSGSLKSGTRKFLVLPPDPDAAKKPRTANNPGRYTLGGYTTLVVTRRPIGERIVNEAHLSYDPPEETIPAPHHEIKLPDGYDTWAAAWIRDTTVLWVAQKGLLRKIDFTNFAKIKESRYDGDNAVDAPIPADIREALRAALDVPNASKQRLESPKPAASVPAAEKRDSPASTSPETAPPKGLDFLKPYPKLHGLSLDMTEPQFLEIVKQQELKTRKTVEGEKVTHHIALGDDHTLIVMFDKDGKCSGIQRVRGEDTLGELEPFHGTWAMDLCDSETKGFGDSQDVVKNWRWAINGNEIVWSRSKDEVWKLTFAVNPTKSPKEIDLTFLDGPHKGEKCLGMYEWGGVNKKMLLMSVQDPGAKVERPKSISMKGGGQTSLIFLEPINAEKELASLQGTWKFEIIQTDSWPKPIGKGPDRLGRGDDRQWVIKGNEITWTSPDGEEVKLSFTIDPTKSPKHFDVTFLSGPHKGQKCLGMYERGGLGGAVLWLCLTDPGSQASRPTKVSYGFDEGRTMIGLIRVERSEKPADKAQNGVQTMRKPALLLPDHWIVSAVGFDNEGQELVTASNQSFITIRRWDVVGMKLISEIKLQADKHGRAFREGTLMFSGDRRRVIAATDAYVGIWETATGKLLTKLPIPKIEDNDTVRILSCTPDFSVIVGGLETNYYRFTLVFDAHTVVWDGNSGKMLRTLTHKGQNNFMAISLSSDGKRFATTNGGGATIWDIRNGEQLLQVTNDDSPGSHSNHVWSIQLSPDGRQLAMVNAPGVKLIDATSGKLLRQLAGSYRYSSNPSPGLVFSKDGQWLTRLGTRGETVAGKAEYVMPIWSTRTGAKLFELHTQANAAAFSDDGQRLAVVFSDMQQALSVWPLSGDAADVEQTAGPGPHSRQDRVEENGHYVGKTAAEFIDKFQPTWGDTQLGLQYGIALTKPQPQRKFRSGERVPLVVFFRNASDKPIKFDTAPDFFGNTPKVLNAKGEPIALENIPLLGRIPHYHETLKPGEALGPFYLSFGLGENPRPGQQHWHPYFKTPVAGQYKLTHSVLINVAGVKDGEESKRDQITSGQLEFEIVDGVKTTTNDPAVRSNPNGEIVGRLVNALTGKPVEGALIACGAIINDSGQGGGANAVTDAEGRYRLPVPSPGIYNVWLKKFDKDPLMTAAADDGILVEAGKVATSQLLLVKGRKVVGYVVDMGKPLANLGVNCYSAARPPSGGVQSVKSQDDGTFEFALPPGRAHLYVIEPVAKSRDNPFGLGRRADAHINVSATEETVPIMLTLRKDESKTGSAEWVERSTKGTQIVRREGYQDVSGVVVDPDGKPIASAQVFKTDEQGVKTNDKGEFLLKTDKGTQFIMHAYAAGFHVWFGTPTSGDVLKIVLEPKNTPNR